MEPFLTEYFTFQIFDSQMR